MDQPPRKRPRDADYRSDPPPVRVPPPEPDEFDEPPRRRRREPDLSAYYEAAARGEASNAGGIIISLLMAALLVVSVAVEIRRGRQLDALDDYGDSILSASNRGKARAINDRFNGYFAICGLAEITLVAAGAIWVATDAKRRGIDGAPMWIILVVLLQPVGLWAYMLGRPTRQPPLPG